MKFIKLIITIFLLFTTLGLFAQKVHFKDHYYKLTNNKIFHRGYNVYGKLSAGERDTIYMIARELYNDDGKLKDKYKNRRKRNRYKLPEGFWKQKEVVVVAKKAIEPVKDEINQESNEQEQVIEEKTEEKLNEENEKVTTRQAKENTESETKEEIKQEKKQKKSLKENTANKPEIKKREKEKTQKKEEKKAVKEKTVNKVEDAKQDEEKVIDRQKSIEKKAEKKEYKQEKKQKKTEKKLKNKEKELKQREKAILLYQSSEKKEKNKAIPVFKGGEAQIVPAYQDEKKWIRHDLWVETEFDTDGDGKLDRMHVAVTRPYQTDSENLKLPIVYVSSPYFAGVADFEKGLFWDVKHELGETTNVERLHTEVIRKGKRPIISNSHIKTWVPRGYIVVHSSSPGTGLSQGSPTVGGDNESLAPKAVIDWLCGRISGYASPYGKEKVKAYWSTGNVGMTGTSYNGTIPLAAATTGVDGLKAIIPIAPNTSYYHYYRSNGLVRSPGGYLGEDIDVLYDFIHSGDESKRAYNNKIIRDTEMKNGMDRITGDYNDFWAGRDYLNDIEHMKAALLMSHGFNDWNVMPEHSYRIYKAAKEKGLPVQIFYHQNGHGGPPPMKMMNRWFTRYLHGIENGVEKDAKAWIVRENNDRKNPTAYKDYPNPMASPIKLYLNSGAPEKGTLSLEKSNKHIKETLIDNYSFSGSALAKSENTNHRLIYVTPTLTENIHISGVAKVSIKLSSSKPAANLSVWLVSLPWTEGKKSKITDNIITRGWADPQNHSSLTKGEPLLPGKFYTVSFDLMPDDQIIPKGQQIGLMIFSSDKEFTLWPKPGTELTIDLDETELTIPVVGGITIFEKAIHKH